MIPYNPRRSHDFRIHSSPACAAGSRAAPAGASVTEHVSAPALGIALALAAGMIAQTLARHLRIPGIVVLLGAGVLLGPDLLGVIRPQDLGQALQTLVGFAVAVILFEGGMNLDLRRLRREARSIRQLVTIGALVTAAGGALAARFFLGWDWTISVLFGSLVIVTGPTVVTPLLRRIRLKPSIATVLEAEGVLVDAIGAIVAVVTLEVVLELALHPVAEGVALGVWELASRLGFGLVFGLAAGLLMALLLRSEHIVPEGLENVLTLSLALAIFQVSNAIRPESGIVTVTVAGIALGNAKTPALEDLKAFKEQLTVMLIGLLFVLLAADIRLEEVRSLGVGGALTVAALMFVVRPLNVLVGTAGSDLGHREKLFLAWLAPRGIVAAAVSSLFAQELDKAGIAGGTELRALVFLVIAATVLIQGLSGGVLARLLGLRRPTGEGYALLGANPLALAMGEVFREVGDDVVFLDSSPDACRVAEERGFRVLFGNALSEAVLARADLDGRAGCIGLTSNDEANFIYTRRAREEFKIPRAWVALRRGHTSVTPAMVEAIGARELFGEPRNLDLWMVRLERGIADTEAWTREEPGDAGAEGEMGGPTDPDNVVLPLAVIRGRRVVPYERNMAFKKHDELRVLILDERRDEAEAWLVQQGWEPKPEEEPEAPGGG